MKATINLVIKIPYEVTDNGYLGTTNSSIDEHMKAAKEEVQRQTVFMKGPTDSEPKQVRATFEVESVVLTP
jgi:hypothetical protein